MNKPEVKRYYYEDGSVESEYYLLNGKLHRENDPAIVCYYENGSIESEHYYLNGKKHREDGPAVVWYYEGGGVESEGYYLNGKELTKAEFDSYVYNKLLEVINHIDQISS